MSKAIEAARIPASLRIMTETNPFKDLPLTCDVLAAAADEIEALRSALDKIHSIACSGEKCASEVKSEAAFSDIRWGAARALGHVT